MKLKVSQKIHYESGPNMTPLVDIVMVILIFMMLTGTFVVGQHYLQSELASSRRGDNSTNTPRLPDETLLQIRIDSLATGGWKAQAGKIEVNSAGPEDPIARTKLTRMLSDLRVELEKEAKTPVDKIQVVISPGKTTKYKDLVEVYSAAMEAKFTKIAFSEAR
jgi:biopolymer transport protein ExbD